MVGGFNKNDAKMAWLFLKTCHFHVTFRNKHNPKISMTRKLACPKIAWVENKPNLIIENKRYLNLPLNFFSPIWWWSPSQTISRKIHLKALTFVLRLEGFSFLRHPSARAYYTSNANLSCSWNCKCRVVLLNVISIKNEKLLQISNVIK